MLVFYPLACQNTASEPRNGLMLHILINGDMLSAAAANRHFGKIDFGKMGDAIAYSLGCDDWHIHFFYINRREDNDPFLNFLGKNLQIEPIPVDCTGWYTSEMDLAMTNRLLHLATNQNDETLGDYALVTGTHGVVPAMKLLKTLEDIGHVASIFWDDDKYYADSGLLPACSRFVDIDELGNINYERGRNQAA